MTLNKGWSVGMVIYFWVWSVVVW